MSADESSSASNPSTASAVPEFRQANYKIIDDRIVRNADAPPLTREEDNSLIIELGRYVESRIVDGMGFIHIPIPGEDASPSTSILASPDWMVAKKLLLIIQNASGSMMGIFSRSLCIDKGLNYGSMLPYISKAVELGYGVLILRPNTNSVTETVTEGERPVKVPIIGSESPEIHTLCVWENVVAKAENATYIALMGYGNGASLVKDLLLRQMVRSKNDSSESNRIRAVVTIEASTILEEDDAVDIKSFVSSIAVNMECNVAARGSRLAYRQKKLGVQSLSLGLPAGEKEVVNVAASVNLALDAVTSYFKIAEEGGPVSDKFARKFASDNGLNYETAVVAVNPNKDAEEEEERNNNPPPPTNSSNSSNSSSSTPPPKPGFFARLFGGGGGAKAAAAADKEEKLTVNDFDLLKIVGKGAFGKVMLVKKKAGVGAGQIYAMKVLKKSVVAAKGQVEHTKSEREILCTIKHPFIVCLRFAFQNEDKLYLVTDYYNGGTLFFHLRKSKHFTEERARFYAAELLLALDHLHSQNIIYRDLKLENVLLDHAGHIALTDFGLSKQNIDKTGGASTFCGTAEYIAPELLKGKQYGKAVDWWSFGILLFEMMIGRTPFYDKNRKLMFYRIINTEPLFPATMSQEGQDCIRGLLHVNESSRFGCGEEGAKEIINTAFFSAIDFDQLYKKEIVPPYQPEVADENDTKYVPKQYLDAEARDSVEEKKGKGKRDDVDKFDAFTFAGDSNM